MEGKPPRVLVAVVLDQDEAAVHWEAFEPTLLAQQTECLWDLLIVDVTAHAGPNYTDWLADVVHRLPRARVRRLSAEHIRDGLVATFSDRRFALKAGMEAATELFGRWHSYEALWLLRPDARPADGDLQSAWITGTLMGRDEDFQALIEKDVNRDETALDRSLENEAIATVAATLQAPSEAEKMEGAHERRVAGLGG